MMNNKTPTCVPRWTASASLLVLLLGLLSGCQPSDSSRLVGDWVGHPDSAASAAERSANRGDQAAGAAPQPDATARNSLGATLLEGVEVRVRLTFQREGDVTMELEGEETTLAGVWRVVADLPPNGVEIEISLLKEGEERGTQKRRFLVDFQPDGDTPGFTLREKGADPQFGRLYFTKQDE